MSVIRAAIAAVPFTKYALGLAGFAAAASIAMRFLGSPAATLIAVAVTLSGSLILLVFANLARAKPKTFLRPAQFVMWATLILFVATLALLFTSFFFGQPLRLQPTSVLAVTGIRRNPDRRSQASGARC
jgi:hypothetical protein